MCRPAPPGAEALKTINPPHPNRHLAKLLPPVAQTSVVRSAAFQSYSAQPSTVFCPRPFPALSPGSCHKPTTILSPAPSTTSISSNPPTAYRRVIKALKSDSRKPPRKHSKMMHPPNRAATTRSGPNPPIQLQSRPSRKTAQKQPPSVPFCSKSEQLANKKKTFRSLTKAFYQTDPPHPNNSKKSTYKAVCRPSLTARQAGRSGRLGPWQ
jgi:hypothetical protein